MRVLEGVFCYYSSALALLEVTHRGDTLLLSTLLKVGLRRSVECRQLAYPYGPG